MIYIKKNVKSFLGYPSDEERLLQQKLLLMSKRNNIQLKINSVVKQIKQKEEEIDRLCYQISQGDMFHAEQRIKHLVRPLLMLKKIHNHYYNIMDGLMDGEIRLEKVDCNITLLDSVKTMVSVTDTSYGSNSDLLATSRKSEGLLYKDEMIADALNYDNTANPEAEVEDFTMSLYYKYSLPIVHTSGASRSRLLDSTDNRDNNNGGGNGGEAILNSSDSKKEAGKNLEA